MSGSARRRVGVVLAALLLAACDAGSGAPRGGLVLRVGDAAPRTLGPAELAALPSDYARGDLHGWTLFGPLVPDVPSQAAAAIEVVGPDGTVRIDTPRRSHPTSQPVVWVDRDQVLRFALVPERPTDAVPHGRGPGDGRGGGQGPAAEDPYAVRGVTEIRILTRPPGPPAPVTAAPPRPASGELDLDVGGKTERLDRAALQAAGGGGERWPLRRIVAARAGDRRVRRVTVIGRRGDPVHIEATAWAGTDALELRLNQRGELKFEGGGGAVWDVTRVDVELE
jgi:hypothetical protein